MTFNGLKLAFISSSILLTACGGGGGGGGSSDNNSGGSTTPQTRTGVLFDAPIANMSYTINGVTKTTNAQGEFQYQAGDNIIFSLGNFNFSSTTSKPLISIIDLLSNNSVDQEVVNLARFIQTIDTNADEDLIQIPDLTGLDLSSLNLDQPISDFEDDPLLQTILNNLGQTDLIDTQEAVDHLYAQAASLEFNLPDLSAELDGDGDGQIDQTTPPPAPDLDSDGDGVNDDQDAFPNDPNETTDTDNDNIGNNADTDDDGDGVLDINDSFPLDGSETVDTDGDGIGNNADNDDDGDGVNDANDDFPLDENESVDTDNDGTGDIADTDDDGDGVNDETDNCPLTANPNQENADGDDFGDVCDFDSDNDGIDDQLDNCPNIANPNQEDADNNGQGDVCDNDADNDGVANELDIDLDGDGLIEISSLEQLNWVRYDLTGSSRHNGTTASTTGCTNCNGYELMNDLNFDTNGDGVLNADDEYFDPDGDGSNKGWLPIGDETNPLLAKFEGNGFTINNLYINRSGNVGLFGVVGEESHGSTVLIENLTLSGELTSVSASSGNAGLLIGQAAHMVTVDTCSVSGDLTSLEGNVGGFIGEADEYIAIIHSDASTQISANGSAGGLIGKNDSILTILNSQFDGAIENDASNTGGIIGHSTNRTIISFIEVTATIQSTNGTAGGLIGLSETESEILAFVSNATVDVELSGTNQLGGVIGYSTGQYIIYNIGTTGSITASNTGQNIGGLAGYSDDLLVSASYSDMTITGNTNVGGLVGHSFGDLHIVASYATGNLEGNQSVGGLVGHVADSGNAEDSATLTKSYSTAAITGNQSIGALIGLDDFATTVNASYWATDVSGQEQAVGTGSGTNLVNSLGVLASELACPTTADTTGCIASSPSTTLFAGWGTINHDNNDETQTISVWHFGDDSERPSINIILPTD